MQPLAGTVERLIALIIDNVILATTVFIIINLFSIDFSPVYPNTYGYLLDIAYFMTLPALWGGFTLAKKAANIRIVKVSGEKVGWSNMIGRIIGGGLVYALSFGVAAIASFFMVIFREDKRAVHDLIGGTKVVKVPDLRKP
ncbi:RDD family protein [Halobacillus litoralis]|uniref:RDD family protein n=1 Tax=Halobacillus litoralis TaxID=45668 RepID=UPI001CD6440E|nr:RDD family protein [Halobacillus litoralis]MCA0972160.1 RDD family protein [Halobacillus litoralis]